MTLVDSLRTLRLALVGLVLATGFASTASAITIDCATVGGSCIGGVYTLDVAKTGTDLYVATYKIDTSVPFTVGATTLVDINIKVANAYTNVSLLEGPGGALGAGPLTGGGCGGSNDSFLCLDLTPERAVGGVYTWKIQFSSSSLLASSDWHVGARYTAPNKPKGWVISESASPVPEPSAALIFGFGMVVAGSFARRSPTRD